MGQPQDFDPKEILHRIGTFFLLIGIGLVVFFILSEAAGKVTFSYFCWSVLLIVIGLIFRGQFKRKVTPSGRFGWVKRFTPKSKQDQGKKQ